LIADAKVMLFSEPAKLFAVFFQKSCFIFAFSIRFTYLCT